jgi:flagellar motor protein MotB
MLVAGAGLTVGGCGGGGDAAMEELLQRNREQQRLLQEKDIQVAQLQDRLRAVSGAGGDIQRMLEKKDGEIASLSRERDAYRRAYEEATGKKLTGGEPPPAGGVPAAILAEVAKLTDQYKDLVEFDRAAARLRFASDLTFDVGSGAVGEDARMVAAALAAILTKPEARNVRALVVGYTDSDPITKPETIAYLKEAGKAPNNQGLSELRAQAVAMVLAASGVDRTRVTTEGRGEKDPIESNRTSLGRAKNRRVEIFLK